MKNSLLKMLVLLIIIVSSSNLKIYSYTSNIVLDFDVEGNRHSLKEMILLKNRVKKGQKVGSKDFEESLQESITNIQNIGFFAAVRPAVVDIEKGKKIIYYVEENDIVKEINVHGNNLISKEKVLDNIKNRPNRIFNLALFREDIEKITENYRNSGYAAYVSDVKYIGKGRVIDIYITEIKLGEVIILGNTLTKDKVIRREVLLKKGDYFDLSRIQRTQEKLVSLGYFDDNEGIIIQQEPGEEPGYMNLVIKVKEGLTGSATFGGGYSSRDGLVGYIQATKGNFALDPKKSFTGDGQTVRIQTKFGGVKTYEFSFIEPWFRDKPISVGFDIYHTRRTFIDYDNNKDEFEIKRKGGALTLGKRFSDSLNLHTRLRSETVDSTRIGDVSGLVQTLSLYLDHDTRDNIRRPRKGIYDTYHFEVSGTDPLKGPRSYTKTKTTFRRFYPLPNENVLAMRFEGGIIDQFKGPELPWYDQFLLGGIDTVRGYETEEFYGRKVFMMNFELRHEINNNLDLVIFQDFGRLWKKVNGSTTEQEWLAGRGIGIHFLTPIGPIRLFFSKAKGRDSFVPNFDIGTNF